MINSKISIIVPVYNVERYLRKCLDSLINQTYKNIEIICVNDGSTDNSLDILNEYANKDKRIIVVNKKNGGLSDARNAGMLKVTGEHMMFVDSDDWIDLETCEKSLDAMIKYSVDVVMWSYTREYTEKSLPKIIFNEDCYFNENETRYQLYRRLFGLYGEELRQPENADAIVTAWGKLYKSKLIMDNDIKFVDTKKIGTEDALFNIEVFKYVHTVYFINKYYNHYRKDNEVSLTSNYKKDFYKKWHNLYDAMAIHITKNNLDDTFKEALNNRIALGMIGLGLNTLAKPVSFFNKRKELKTILKDNQIKNVVKSLDISYFPLHWKIFFYCISKNQVLFLLILLQILNFIRSR